MEMRARDDTPTAQDLIPSTPPLAATLHDRFLSSHCSSCFLPIPQTTPAFSCPTCHSLSYCSLTCLHSDLPLHHSSRECLLRSRPSTCHYDDSADLRAALRLRQTLGPGPPRRIAGLSVENLEAVLGSGSDMESRIREGAAVMRRARGEEGEGMEEEEVLWAVLTNAVEVQVSEGSALGIGVYGPWFSWFNHSCSPNACYRFEVGSSRLDSCGSGSFRVSPASNGEATDLWKAWVNGGSSLMKVPGLTKYGPRVVARSIKPIKKGEEVCIAYTDLLQPKEMRHCDLWSKYRFVCCCERCSALPEMYVDSILKSDAWSLVTNHDNSKEADCDDLAEFLDQTIAEYMSDGNPEACCKKIENMLCGILEGSPIQEPSKTNFRLHPLHYLSLNAYIALSSACKVLSTNLLATDSNKQSKSRASNVHRASVGYSLLLAGATHHLFMSESSLLANSAVLWASAGESIIDFLRISCKTKFKLYSHPEFPREAYKCKETSLRFLECISKKLTWSWLYLVRGLYYLENVKSPVDFSWLGLENICQVTEDWRNAADFCLCDEYKFDNNGTLAWPFGTQLVWVGGDQFGDRVSSTLEIPANGFPVDKELDIAVDFTAPSRPGRYVSYWRMASLSGQQFGQRVWVLIQVDYSRPNSAAGSNVQPAFNLNLPPDSSSQNLIIDVNAEPLDSGLPEPSVTTTTEEPVKPVAESVIVGEPVQVVGGLLDAGNVEHHQSTPAAAVPPVASYPLINLQEMPPMVDEFPVTESAATADSNPVEQTLLKELEDMGFKEINLNKEILRLNEYNLEQSVDDLCGFAEWDPLLCELHEMGFNNREMNKKALIKNGGSIKRAVLDLIAGQISE